MSQVGESLDTEPAGRSRHSFGDALMWLTVYAAWLVIFGCIVFEAVAQ